MNEEPIDATICTAMMRLGTRMATLFDQSFSHFEITQAQFRVLLAIHKSGDTDGIAPSVLARNLLLERATVSVLTQRLLERGLLHRAPGENRRSFRLRLTPEGETLLWTIIPHASALATRTLSANTRDDRQAALRFFERLEANLRGMTGSDDTPTNDAPLHDSASAKDT